MWLFLQVSAQISKRDISPADEFLQMKLESNHDVQCVEIVPQLNEPWMEAPWQQSHGCVRESESFVFFFKLLSSLKKENERKRKGLTVTGCQGKRSNSVWNIGKFFIKFIHSVSAHIISWLSWEHSTHPNGKSIMWFQVVFSLATVVSSAGHLATNFHPSFPGMTLTWYVSYLLALMPAQFCIDLYRSSYCFVHISMSENAFNKKERRENKVLQVEKTVSWGLDWRCFYVMELNEIKEEVSDG